MSDPTILFVKPGAVKPGDKGRLFKAGVCVVEVENPQDVQLISARNELPHGVLLGCAAKAISTDSTTYVKRAFSDAICAALQASAEAKAHDH